MMVGGLYIGPFLILHVADWFQVRLDLGANLRAYLQCSLFRKYLNFSEESVAQFSPSAVSLVIIKESGEVVEKGFLKVVELQQTLGKIVIASCFIISENALAAVPILLFPIVIMIWFSLSLRKAIAVSEEQAACEEDIV